MEDMKDSGIPWLGEIPAEWDITRLKYFINIFSGDFIDRKEVEDNGLYPVFGGGECIGYTNKYNVDKKSIIIGRVGARCGCVNLLHEKAWATDNALILETTLNVRYCYYLLLANDLNKLNHSNAQPLITGYKIKNSFYPFIKLNEQQRIADFLDEKCGEIDGIVVKIQQEMDTLKQYKQSIISEAVTKGICPNVPLKDSGISWIGKIPKHWQISKIKYQFNCLLGKMVEKNNQDLETDDSYLCAANIKWSGVDTSIRRRMFFNKSEKKRYLLKKNDVLIMEGGATSGTACIYQEEFSPCYMQNSIIRCRAKYNQDYRYLYYWLHITFDCGYIDAICNQATFRHFTKEKVECTPFPCIPLEEQREIAAYLDQKCAAIDAIISSKEEQLQTLSSYKKSLIYEYVTGKKRVPTA